VLSVGNRPVLIPGLLLAGALLAFLLPAPWRRTRRLGAAAVLVLAGWAALSIAPFASTGPVISSYGVAVPGVPLSLRADATGLTLLVMALVAALLSLGAADRQPGEESALLLTAAGTAVAALAGNVVLLFAGAEIASLGGLLLVTAGRGRLSPGAITGFTIQHVLCLGLLVAAVELTVATGTSNPYAVPASAVGVTVALPWALAGAGRLLAAGWWPGAAGGRPTRSWLAIGAVPCAAAILLRLDAATGGAAGPGSTVFLAVLGAAAALWGAVSAWRWKHESRRAGRALLGAAAGALVAVVALPDGSGAFAAGLMALELALLAAPAWSQPARPNRRGRVLAAVALAAAGGLPIGFGASAAVLELGAVSAMGRAYTALLVALGLAVVVAAAGGLVAARQALGSAATAALPAASSPPPGQGLLWRPDAVLALVAGAVAAVVPGVVDAAVLTPLVGSSAPAAIDAATLHGPGGGWPGGYLSLALLVVLVGVVSAGLVLGRPLPRPAHGEQGPRPRPAWIAFLAPRRALGPAAHRLGGALSRTDAWLVGQPGLVFVVVVALAALLLFHYI
jgi:hypothetical protein